MKKLLLVSIILFILSPKPATFAQSTETCTDGQVKSPRFSIETNDATKCPEDTVCTTRSRSLFRCWGPRPANAGAQPGAQQTAPEATPCTGPNCTKGSGQACTPGSSDPNSKGPGGIRTAIGCIPTEPKALVSGLLKYATFASGGIALLLMILAALSMITAEGNPDTIKKAQEKFYSAIIGLLLVIFATLLMQVIGVDILGLPGFGKAAP